MEEAPVVLKEAKQEVMEIAKHNHSSDIEGISNHTPQLTNLNLVSDGMNYPEPQIVDKDNVSPIVSNNLEQEFDECKNFHIYKNSTNGFSVLGSDRMAEEMDVREKGTELKSSPYTEPNRVVLGHRDTEFLRSKEGFNSDEEKLLFNNVSSSKPPIKRFQVNLASFPGSQQVEMELYADPKLLIENVRRVFYRATNPWFFGTIYDSTWKDGLLDTTKDRIVLYSYDAFEGMILTPRGGESRLMMGGCALRLCENDAYSGKELLLVIVATV